MVTASEVAWWLWVGEAEPTLANRFLSGSPDETRQRQELATRVAQLMEAAESAGIGGMLNVVLHDLLHQQATGNDPSQA